MLMRIAYISFEYPPDTAVGGIATYVYQVSKMMKSRGHDVEVFCGSPTRTVSETFEGILVHRVLTDTGKFPKDVLSIFQKKHEEHAFDLIESPEYSGDGYEIKKRFPSLPMVVKLHTPAAFILALDNSYSSKKISLYRKGRHMLGGLLKGEIREGYWKKGVWRNKATDIDYLTTALADQIHTPSTSLGDIVSKKWAISRSHILNVPYPFVPAEEFLKIPICATQTKNVTFIGRLEIRKGLIELAKAIPYVCEAVPDVKFKFVGKPVHSIIPGMSMDEYIKKQLVGYESRLEFTQATPKDIPSILSNTDVCVFPSIWENFPNVCLESMSAGRGIVGSNQGGMKDMLEYPKAGLLVNPLNSRAIAEAIICLLNDAELRTKLGEAARQKVLQAYNKEVIGSLMEKCYSDLL
ncbi:glycosyltransferase family 4 protein [Hymenobacter sp. GOD-10R]|uniref:glycosyltransferase family 4 protein n=1 Tax=Hymenobacter sp. GOD-10R TaxID=3093922 RepID=UPI002D79E6A4|nr:glycosyltransferase family 4 protein [Hymenobacter sp. GOD-10R]WRQ27459.1 glycosyltransferase family 4 protein [Hymenobacter sp. GOD-10R]